MVDEEKSLEPVKKRSRKESKIPLKSKESSAPSLSVEDKKTLENTDEKKRSRSRPKARVLQECNDILAENPEPVKIKETKKSVDTKSVEAKKIVDIKSVESRKRKSPEKNLRRSQRHK